MTNPFRPALLFQTGTFKLVTDREDSIVPDLDSTRSTNSWTKSAFKIEDSVAGSHDWKSPVFSLFDKSHPASTGKAHPSVTGGSGHTTGAYTGAPGTHSTSSHGYGNTATGDSTGYNTTGSNAGYNSASNAAYTTGNPNYTNSTQRTAL